MPCARWCQTRVSCCEWCIRDLALQQGEPGVLRLVRQQPPFGRQPAAVAGERAVCADDAVARAR